MTKQRIEYVDAAKAIAIILVIFAHCHYMIEFPRLGNLIYSFHMPLFFIVSGFFLKEMTTKRAIGKYSSAYLWPYLVLVISSILLETAISYWKSGGAGFNLAEKILGLIYGNPYQRDEVMFGKLYGVSNAWFFLAIFWACSILSTSMHYLKKEEVVLMSLLSLGFGAFVSRKIQLPFEISAGLTAVAYIYIGKVFAIYHVINRIENIRLSLLGLAVFVFVLLSNAGRVAMNISYLGYSVFGLFCSVVGSIFILFLCKHFDLKGGWIGRNTLYVFVAHSLIQCLEKALNLDFTFTEFSILNLFFNAILDIFGALLLGYFLQYTHILEYKKLFKQHEHYNIDRVLK